MNLTYEKIEELKRYWPDFLDRFCLINGAPILLDELESMGYSEFALRAKVNMPTKLYKYFPNTTSEKEDPVTHDKHKVNYSVQALKSNEVFLNCPTGFDDVYDSSIYIEWTEFLQKRLQHYCALCGIMPKPLSDIDSLLVEFLSKLSQAIVSGGDMITAFDLTGQSKGTSLSVQVFINRLTITLLKGKSGQDAVMQALWEEYDELQSEIHQLFRITCFTTAPYSQLMWGGQYANCHSGFCIEYEVTPNDESLQDVYYNLFPVIYSRGRSDISDSLIHWQDVDITEDVLWNIYFHGTLRKSFEWAYQTEWRLLMPDGINGPNYTVPFFPIRKVYLGNRMKKEQRQEIIEICHAKGIPYVGVTRAQDRFEMKECEILCEECPKYKDFHD